MVKPTITTGYHGEESVSDYQTKAAWREVSKDIPIIHNGRIFYKAEDKFGDPKKDGVEVYTNWFIAFIMGFFEELEFFDVKCEKNGIVAPRSIAVVKSDADRWIREHEKLTGGLESKIKPTDNLLTKIADIRNRMQEARSDSNL